MSEQPGDGRPILPAALVVSAVALAALTLILNIATIERSPLVGVDEIYLASAALSLNNGGSGVPTVLPDGPWNISFPAVYGPVFFQAIAALVRGFGLSASSVRAVGLGGAVAMALIAGWMARRAGATPAWSIVAGVIVWLVPDMSKAATNGRMDTLAPAFALGAMAWLVLPAGTSMSRAIRAGLASGACLCLALLTTPRMLLAAGALPLAYAACVIHERAIPRRLTAAVGVAALSAAAGVSLWLWSIGTTPLRWVAGLIAGTAADTYNSVTPGTSRGWSLGEASSATAAVALAAVIAWAVLRRRSTARADTAWAPGTFGLAWAGVAAIAYIARVNNTFSHGVYFVIPLLAAALAALGSQRVTPNAARVVSASAVLVLAMLTIGRLAKYADIFESWSARDEAPLDRFVQAHVPPGSIVFGADQFYFYAVQRSGSRFMTLSTDPFPGSPTIGQPPAAAQAALAQRFSGGYLIWPDDPMFPMPGEFACVARGEVAVFQPALAENRLNALPAFGTYAYLRVYPRTRLFRIPAGCPSPAPL